MGFGACAAPLMGRSSNYDYGCIYAADPVYLQESKTLLTLG